MWPVMSKVVLKKKKTHMHRVQMVIDGQDSKGGVKT